MEGEGIGGDGESNQNAGYLGGVKEESHKRHLKQARKSKVSNGDSTRKKNFGSCFRYALSTCHYQIEEWFKLADYLISLAT